MWCVPEVNEAYLGQMEDLLKLYEKPHNPQEPVVCLDEKPVPLHADVRPLVAAQPGQPAKRDGEYKRQPVPRGRAAGRTAFHLADPESIWAAVRQDDGTPSPAISFGSHNSFSGRQLEHALAKDPDRSFRPGARCRTVAPAWRPPNS